MLTEQHAVRFADVALGHVTREYPHKLDQVLSGPDDLRTPSTLHPIFHGSFDWHSCVHAYWLLARLLHLYPPMAHAERIRALITAAITPEHVAAEVDYLSRPHAAGFERPYGWAWLLMLAAELKRHSDHAVQQSAAILAPLADAFAQRFLAWLPKATYPIRTGVHSNTAFALALGSQYAATCGHGELMQAIRHAGRQWYLADRDCQAWEPGGEDFLSPALIEAECMRRLLPATGFADWFDAFLPRLAQGEPATLLRPVVASDRSDGRIAHLDGLNLSRAWCWSSIAAALPQADPRREIMREAARRHVEASLDAVSGDYMGEHWLATFAALALEAS